MSYVKTLFSDKDLSALIRQADLLLNQKIGKLPEKSILDVGSDILAAEVIEEFHLNVPQLLEDQTYVSDRETKIDISGDPRYFNFGRGSQHVDGVQVTFHVPYSGDGNLFEFQTNQWGSMMPRAIVLKEELQMFYSSTDHDGEKLKTDFQRNLALVRQYLDRMKEQVKPHNEQLLSKAKTFIENRRQKILADKGMVASLGFPLKKRTDALKTYIAPSVKRKVSLRPTTPTSAPFKPEPTLAEEEYKNILSIITNMVLVMERSPAAFQSMKEEDLRQHFLVQLNAQYEGQATGETFNYSGKTDILIREQGKNIFLAECKFWQGESVFTETIDQILGYASWRDNKTAILIFNRNKNFSAVLAQIKPIVEKHPSFVRFVDQKGETEFKFIFRHQADLDRELVLSVLAFDIPAN